MKVPRSLANGGWRSPPRLAGVGSAPSVILVGGRPPRGRPTRSDLVFRLGRRACRTPSSKGTARVNSKHKPAPTQRQARLAAVKAAQKRTERRRTILIASIAGVVALGLIGTTTAVIVQQARHNASVQAAATAPIAGVKTFTGLSRNHVTGTVAYAQDPPVGGDHSAVDENCGFYSAPVADENAVHSLEHGAVWITHDANLPAAQLATLRGVAAKNAYVLVTPRAGLPTPVVASAWGVQLQLSSVDDPRLAAFVAKYANGPQTPEPGAACSGGIGTPDAP